MKISNYFTDRKILFLLGIIICTSALFAQTSNYAYPSFPKDQWVLIGFPVTPTDPDPDAVWGPYFGGGQGHDDNADNTQWRFSRWNNYYDAYVRWGELDRDTNGVYTDIGEPTAIITGWGYWFYQNNASEATFNVTGTKANDQQSYQIQLDAPQNNHRGRTMVGNPFTFPIDWKNSEVIVHSESEHLDMTIPLLTANEMGLIDQHAYPWNMGLISGQDSGYLPYNATTGGVLPNWQGFWVEQLNRCAENLITYHVIHPQGDNLCQFQQAHYGRINQQDDLGNDQIPETDRFIMVVLNPESTIEVETKSQGNATVSFTNWQTLPDGTQLTNSNGFEVTLVDWIDNGDNKYTFTFDIRATIEPAKGWSTGQWMEHVIFTFGSNNHVTDVLYPSAPNHGNDEDPYIPWSNSGNGNAAAYTALRSIENAIGQASDIVLTLKIPPTNVSLAKMRSEYLPTDVVALENERDWIMPLSVRNTDGSVQDNFNAIGIMANASDGYDINDVAQQSPPDTYLEIYFPHNEMTDFYNYWYERPVSVCYDLRADSSHKEWKMVVAAYTNPQGTDNVKNQQCTIHWDASPVSAEWSLQLQDKDRNVLVEDMKVTNEYSFNTQDVSYSTETYYISATFLPALVGIKTEVVPVSYALLQNYPNPFNASTTIRYQVQKSEKTTLRIYSNTGSLVRTLIENTSKPGTYSVRWDGRNDYGQIIGSGMYICQLRNGNDVTAIKIALIK
ncbi:MAG: T9SS type A sorting domain-containing protein [Candidatus Neomarinimicrobiota bacterium]